MSLLELAWEERETTIYPRIFGKLNSNICVLDFEIFKNTFGREEVDPTWLHAGVLVSPSSDKRNSWVYTTSGMSNPWGSEEKQEYSGLGIELFVETDNEMPDAVQLLLNLMAFNILLSVGHYGDKPMLEYGDRVPTEIKPNITHVVLAEPKDYNSSIELVSGRVDLMQVVGLVQPEFEFAKEHSSLEIIEKIHKSIGSLNLVPNRESVINPYKQLKNGERKR